MIARSDIVTHARGWIGTPYVHQASRQGAGADCLGLVRGVWRQLYGTEPDKVPDYTMDWSEPQRTERLREAAARHMREKPIEMRAAGDVLLFRMRDRAVAKHLGILANTANHETFVHAYGGRGVVESPLSVPWRRRIVGCFEFPQGVG